MNDIMVMEKDKVYRYFSTGNFTDNVFSLRTDWHRYGIRPSHSCAILVLLIQPYPRNQDNLEDKGSFILL